MNIKNMSENEKFIPETEVLNWEKVSENGSISVFVDVNDRFNDDFQQKVLQEYFQVRTNKGREGFVKIDFDNGEKVVEVGYTKKWDDYKKQKQKERREIHKPSIYNKQILKEIRKEDRLKASAGSVQVSKKILKNSNRPKWKDEINNLPEEKNEVNIVDRPAES